MKRSIADRFGFGRRELVSVVGAGGKSTIMLAIAKDLTSRGLKIVLTTTTKMAQRQISEPTCWTADPSIVESLLETGIPLFVMSGRDDKKVKGLSPDDVNRIFTETSVDFVLVEADGARSMSIKAPAAHEPVVPGLSTTVIVVMGADALGRQIRHVAHRPERLTEVAGTQQDAVITSELAARVLLSNDGGLKGVPKTARVVMAITKVSRENDAEVARLTATLSADDRVQAVALFSLEGM